MDILVVDDDALSLRLLIALVEKLGHHPISASDGLSAWELYRKHDCRVVISDWTSQTAVGFGEIVAIFAPASRR